MTFAYPHADPVRGRLRVVVYAIVIAVILAVVAVVASIYLSGQQKTAGSLPPNTDVVNVADLVPQYHGEATTWQHVWQERAHGRAQAIWIYSTDDGDHAIVFDRKRQLNAWLCSPAGVKAGLCGAQQETQATTNH